MASERTAQRRAPLFIDPPGYARHRPEETLLYQLYDLAAEMLEVLDSAGGRAAPFESRYLK